MFTEGKRVINGTWGEVWLDSELVAECYGLQLKVSTKKEDIFLCGQMMKDKKVTATEGTGSLRLYKSSSIMAKKLATAISSGRDLRFTIISKLADPDAYGAERVSVSGVSFDDLTLADWERGKNGTVEAPFTFTKFEYLDMIPEE